MKFMIFFSSIVLLVNVAIAQTCATNVAFNHSADGLIGFFESTSQSNCEIQSLRWDFGDGTFSTAPNPIHTFPTPGEYNVCLELITLSNEQEIQTQSSCLAIEIGLNICSLIPEVQLDVLDGMLTATNITQTNQSTEVISCTWDFGDGQVATGEVLDHEYQLSGLYEVCVEIEALSGNQTCSAHLCKQIQIIFEVPEFDLAVNEQHLDECLYQLQAAHDLPLDVELLSRTWYYEDESYLGDNFALNASDQEPLHVLLKENYYYRGELFSKTFEYIIYPNCQSIDLGIMSNQLEQTRIQAHSGLLRVNNSVALDRIAVYTLDGRMLVETAQAEEFSFPLKTGIHLVRIELAGEFRTYKVACF